MEENVLSLIREVSLSIDVGGTAELIAAKLSISRNRASSILNDMVKKGQLIKIKTRPVLFFCPNTLYKTYRKKIDRTVYDSLNELKQLLITDPLEGIIGYNGSLENILFQVKAAVSYSNKGLPIMFVGESGTGKTFIAKKVYDFSKDQKLIANNAPFVHVNCSEYANNPELFLANVFGSVKGAYTGAYKDNNGIIDEAQNGYLFLDEVHALSKSCQEKLFQFIDDGKYHKLGDNETWFYADVRLLFATTEYPSKNFLTTFLRRIPVILQVPSWRERTKFEKVQLLSSFLVKEEIEIGRTIKISENVLKYLVRGDFKGNIGELRNILKLAVAKESFVSSGEEILISRKNIVSAPEQSNDLEEIIYFDANKLSELIVKDSQAKETVEALAAIIDGGFNKEEMNLPNLLTQLRKILLDSRNTRPKQLTVEKSTLLEQLPEIFSEIETSNQYGYFYFSKKNTDYSLLASLLVEFCSEENLSVYNEINHSLQPICDTIDRHLSKERNIVEHVVEILDSELSINNLGRIVLYTFIDYYLISSTQNRNIGIIMAHGNQVASEIANSVNHMLNSYIFESINLALDTNPKEASLILNEVLKKRSYAEKVAILTDMGSLTNLNIEEFNQKSDFILANSINPPLALSIGNDLLEDASLDTIAENIAIYSKMFSAKTIKKDNKKKGIISSCASGPDIDKKIADILKKSFPEDENMEIITLDYSELIEKGTISKVLEKYDVRFVIGTLDPDIEKVPFVSVGSLIANNAKELFYFLLKDVYDAPVIDQIVKNLLNEFTLTNLVNELTILNPTKLLQLVTAAIDCLETKLDFSIPVSTSFGLYVHICCMVERLIRVKNQEPELVTEVDEEFRRKFKEAFESVEEYYCVDIPDEEVYYIMSYIYME